jgi:hypothetical protein
MWSGFGVAGYSVITVLDIELRSFVSPAAWDDGPWLLPWMSLDLLSLFCKSSPVFKSVSYCTLLPPTVITHLFRAARTRVALSLSCSVIFSQFATLDKVLKSHNLNQAVACASVEMENSPRHCSLPVDPSCRVWQSQMTRAGLVLHSHH